MLNMIPNLFFVRFHRTIYTIEVINTSKNELVVLKIFAYLHETRSDTNVDMLGRTTKKSLFLTRVTSVVRLSYSLDTQLAKRSSEQNILYCENVSICLMGLRRFWNFWKVSYKWNWQMLSVFFFRIWLKYEINEKMLLKKIISLKNLENVWFSLLTVDLVFENTHLILFSLNTHIYCCWKFLENSLWNSYVSFTYWLLIL